MGKNYLHWIYSAKNTYNEVYVSYSKYAKKIIVNDVPKNNYEFLNIGPFISYGCTQCLVTSCKYWVVPRISTRVSGYSQVILKAGALLSRW